MHNTNGEYLYIRRNISQKFTTLRRNMQNRLWSFSHPIMHTFKMSFLLYYMQSNIPNVWKNNGLKVIWLARVHIPIRVVEKKSTHYWCYRSTYVQKYINFDNTKKGKHFTIVVCHQTFRTAKRIRRSNKSSYMFKFIFLLESHILLPSYRHISTWVHVILKSHEFLGYEKRFFFSIDIFMYLFAFEPS